MKDVRVTMVLSPVLVERVKKHQEEENPEETISSFYARAILNQLEKEGDYEIRDILEKLEKEGDDFNA